MARAAVFSPVTVFWLLAVGCLTFAGAVYFAAFGTSGGVAAANAYSYAAIGHRAFVETLRRLEIPVVVSRNDSAGKASESSLLVIAEPSLGFGSLLKATNVLLVLPKRVGEPSRARRGWLENVRPIARTSAEWALRELDPDGAVRRVGPPGALTVDRLGVAPTLEKTQLIASARIKPIVAAKGGILVGEIFRGTSRIWVLSDPDILSNHGLGDGDNAVLALAIVNALRGGDGAVVFDETVHGFRQRPSLLRTLFRFPFIVVTVQVAAAIVALALSATGRFGAPIPSKPAIAPGKAALLGNTASLLEYGGHAPELLRRYGDAALRDVVHRLRAPRRLDRPESIDWVDRIGRSRGVSASFLSLNQQTQATIDTATAQSPRVVDAARDLYRWKQEMTHGS